MILQQEFQHIRLGQSIQTGSIVQQLHNPLPAKLRNTAAEGFHDLLHFSEAGTSIKFKAVQGIEAVAIGFVQLLQLLQKADAPGGIVAEHFADHVRAVYAVLVPDVGAGEVAIAFLKAKNVAIRPALLFQLADLLADKLETRQHIHGSDTVVPGNLFSHIHGDNGFDHHGIGRHFAMLDALAANIVQQQEPRFIAGEQLIVPLGSFHGNAHPVAIRVRSQQQIRLASAGIFHAQGHGFPNLRVGIGAGGEIAVRLLLLRHHGDVGIAHLPKGPGDRL